MNAISRRTLAVREQPLPEPVIQCPHCQGDIKLTESLAAPFIRAREAEFKRQEAGLREREAALDAQITERVAIERKKVEEEAQRKARLALGTGLESSKRELVEANDSGDCRCGDSLDSCDRRAVDMSRRGDRDYRVAIRRLRRSRAH